MSMFDGREKAFEDKFKHDAELQFKVTARRNKLLGLWAAAQMGLSGAQAEQYAKEVVASDFYRPGDDDVVEKIAKDFKEKNVAVTVDQIRVQLNSLLPEAKKQIMAA